MCASIEAPTAQTALAFVGSDANGGRSLSSITGMADTLLSRRKWTALIANARIFHFGSVTLAAEPSRTDRFAAAQRARAALLVSFDPRAPGSVIPRNTP